MTSRGRPTLYKREHASRARKLCARGARACMSWLRDRHPEDWRAKAEAAPEIANDDLAAALDAAGERLRHAGD